MGKNCENEIEISGTQLTKILEPGELTVLRGRKSQCYLTGKEIPPGEHFAFASSAWTGKIYKRALSEQVLVVLMYKLAKQYLRPKIRKQIEDLMLARKI